MPVIDLNQVRTEKHWTNRVKDFGKKACKKAKETVEYVKNNPEQAMARAGAIAAILGGTTKVVQSVNRHIALKQEKHHREREVYDRSLNMYLETRRKLTKKDFDKINEIKRKTGKRTSEVLSDLGLLKR